MPFLLATYGTVPLTHPSWPPPAIDCWSEKQYQDPWIWYSLHCSKMKPVVSSWSTLRSMFVQTSAPSPPASATPELLAPLLPLEDPPLLPLPLDDAPLLPEPPLDPLDASGREPLEPPLLPPLLDPPAPPSPSGTDALVEQDSSAANPRRAARARHVLLRTNRPGERRSVPRR